MCSYIRENTKKHAHLKNNCQTAIFCSKDSVKNCE